MAKVRRERRSDCPLNISLEIFGDRWTLLIVRDIMLKGRRTFREFLDGGERIASNVLAERLTRLEEHSIVERDGNPADRRSQIYRLTEKGIELAPVLLEMILWAARHEDTAAPPNEVRQMSRHRDTYLSELRQRWEEGRNREPRSLSPKSKR
jgi:DNA-binding HxlR family transcriptional regulator